jgi:hypothetical protein
MISTYPHSSQPQIESSESPELFEKNKWETKFFFSIAPHIKQIEEVVRFNQHIAKVTENWRALVDIRPTTPRYEEIFDEALAQGLKTHSCFEISLETVKKQPLVLRYVPKETPEFKTIALTALKRDSHALKDLLEKYPEFINDFPFLLEAIEEYNASCIAYIPVNTPRHRELVDAAIEKDPDTARLVPRSFERPKIFWA